MAGIVYRTWVTPIAAIPGKFNTRTGIGGWGNRVGVFAYALTPLTVALASRESVLSLITGIPYQHFNFLHRWSGRIIYVQSVLHTIMWTIVQANLYQPQPRQYRNFIRQQYMIFGCFATLFVSFLFFFSLRPVIRWTGYEFFRKAHYFVALLYIGACWGHWAQLACWMIPSLALFFIDRGLRLLRTAWIHFGKKGGSGGIGFRAAEASITRFDDGEASVVRLDFVHDRGAWDVGQHFFLCFPELTVWQSHPMTPAAVASPGKPLKHAYIIRAMKGETRRLADIASLRIKPEERPKQSTSVVLSGPYGRGVLDDHRAVNVLAVAGGTGISFALPIVQKAIAQAKETKQGAVELIWMVRKTENILWIAEELAGLRAELQQSVVDLQVKIYVTRDDVKLSSSASLASQSSGEKKEPTENITTAETSSFTSSLALNNLIAEQNGFSVEWLSDHHPNLKRSDGSCILEDWLKRGAVNGSRSQVFASGPAGLGTDLRVAVAAKNDASKVFKGDGSGDVGFYWDDRFS
jgi:ferric-chelate reductase